MELKLYEDDLEDPNLYTETELYKLLKEVMKVQKAYIDATKKVAEQEVMLRHDRDRYIIKLSEDAGSTELLDYNDNVKFGFQFILFGHSISFKIN